VATFHVNSAGITKVTSLPNFDSPLSLPAGGRRAFYIATTDMNLLVTESVDGGEGIPIASDSRIEVQAGIGSRYGFGDVSSVAYGWNGVVRYESEKSWQEGEECVPLNSDCFKEHGGVGCAVPTCREEVCQQDIFCCISYDSYCVQKAGVHCQACD